MVYKAIGLMSGSSTDGLDIVFAHFQERGGKWGYELKAAACYAYEKDWEERLLAAASLPAAGYLLLHSAYGHYLGRSVIRFMEEMEIHLQVDLVASHGHTVFHLPAEGMTAQLGDGAAIAAETGLAVVSDLRALDVALGGQGAPIVPVGEKLLFPEYDLLLNIGGIANLSFHSDGQYTAFDVCPANRVLNVLARQAGKEFDEDGQLAAAGQTDASLLDALDELSYYRQLPPKSLANEFGTEVVLPLLQTSMLSTGDKLRTYVEHIALQVTKAARRHTSGAPGAQRSMLVTGGGAFNDFLVQCIAERLSGQGIRVQIPDATVVKYKEAIIMALLGVLRWREENTVLASVTGARRNSIGGALWMGH